MEPEQFLHEALGFIAFIVPFVLIVVAGIVVLNIIIIVIYGALVIRENRKGRKKFEERKAQRIAARDRAYGRKSL